MKIAVAVVISILGTLLSETKPLRVEPTKVIEKVIVLVSVTISIALAVDSAGGPSVSSLGFRISTVGTLLILGVLCVMPIALGTFEARADPPRYHSTVSGAALHLATNFIGFAIPASFVLTLAPMKDELTNYASRSYPASACQIILFGAFIFVLWSVNAQQKDDPRHGRLSNWHQIANVTYLVLAIYVGLTWIVVSAMYVHGQGSYQLEATALPWLPAPVLAYFFALSLPQRRPHEHALFLVLTPLAIFGTLVFYRYFQVSHYEQLMAIVPAASYVAYAAIVSALLSGGHLSHQGHEPDHTKLAGVVLSSVGLGLALLCFVALGLS